MDISLCAFNPDSALGSMVDVFLMCCLVIINMMSLLRSYDLWSCSFTGANAPAYNHCQSYGLPWLLTWFRIRFNPNSALENIVILREISSYSNCLLQPSLRACEAISRIARLIYHRGVSLVVSRRLIRPSFWLKPFVCYPYSVS